MACPQFGYLFSVTSKQTKCKLPLLVSAENAANISGNILINYKLYEGLKAESVLSYERRSVGQSVWYQATICGPRPILLSSPRKLFSDNFAF
jgi:hypothetical protein